MMKVSKIVALAGLSGSANIMAMQHDNIHHQIAELTAVKLTLDESLRETMEALRIAKEKEALEAQAATATMTARADEHDLFYQYLQKGDTRDLWGKINDTTYFLIVRRKKTGSGFVLYQGPADAMQKYEVLRKDVAFDGGTQKIQTEIGAFRIESTNDYKQCPCDTFEGQQIEVFR